MLKVQIELIPDRWDDVNEVLERALESTTSTLDDLREKLKHLDVKRSLKIGFGSSHCWVSDKNNNRILLITE